MRNIRLLLKHKVLKKVTLGRTISPFTDSSEVGQTPKRFDTLFAT